MILQYKKPTWNKSAKLEQWSRAASTRAQDQRRLQTRDGRNLRERLFTIVSRITAVNPGAASLSSTPSLLPQGTTNWHDYNKSLRPNQPKRQDLRDVVERLSQEHNKEKDNDPKPKESILFERCSEAIIRKAQRTREQSRQNFWSIQWWNRYQVKESQENIEDNHLQAQQYKRFW